ncbi:MAG: MFS transporter, partial [Candidatus Binatia bacterium]|nr:MFS transporter [Candidatus Binatia bacterium]
MANALRFRDYRLLWVGSLISNIGEGMKEVAEDWLVFVMTGSPFYLGLVSFCKGPTRLLLGPVFGVMVDRLDRKKVMITAQAFHLSITLVYAILVATHTIQFWHILILAVLDGFVLPVVRITRQTLVPDLVPRESLLSALSLHTVGAHASHVIGPLFGGVLIVWIGVDGVLFLISLSFFAVIIGVWLLHLSRKEGELPGLKLLEEISKGLSFVKGNPTVLHAMAFQFFCFFLVLPFTRLLPVYAKNILHIGPTGLGLLRGCLAGGSVLGGLGIASFGDRKNKERIIFICSIFITLSLLLFAQAFWLPLSLLLLASIGISSTVFRVHALSLIQLNV